MTVRPFREAAAVRRRTSGLLGFAFVLITTLVGGPVLADGLVTVWDREALARAQSPPLGLPPTPVPEENPLTAEKIALGRKLFFDRRLSANGTMSCAMCHVPEQGFTQYELRTPIGVEGRSLKRNAPTILNVAHQENMFHDARETSLELQVFGPLLAANEMANPSIGHAIETIQNAADYDGLFEQAFGSPVDVRNLGQAIASYERTVLSGDSPFDRWRYGGDETALSDAAIRGFTLFVGTAGCSSCHVVGEEGTVFTDNALHDTGIGSRAEHRSRLETPVPVEIQPGVVVQLSRAAVDAVGEPQAKDLGRHEVTRDPADLYQYKTPGLRDVARTAPYMHDGSISTLAEVVAYYDAGGFPSPGLDPAIRPLGLSEGDRRDLVAFLEALNGDNIDALIADARSTTIGNVTTDP